VVFFSILAQIEAYCSPATEEIEVRGDIQPFGSAVQASCGIAVMAKASYPGRTKTRLVPPLTFEEAAAFNTAFLQDMAANIAAADREIRKSGGRVAGHMAFGPPRSEPFFRANLPAAVGLIEAWHPDFGDCLFAAIEALFSLGHNGAVVLNSDSPTLPTALLAETAQVLARPGDRAVLGPSIDGGYYLLGLKTPHRRLFEDVAWSTAAVARQTLERAAGIGLTVHVLAPWYDVDDIETLRLLRSELCGGVPFAPRLASHDATHARRLLVRLLRETDLAQRLAGRTGVRDASGFANPIMEKAGE
jgi:rSAM/selenodomain-associated transferase 1